MTDPIADLLVRLTNAQGVRAETVDIPHSKLKEEIIKLLTAEGYLAKYEGLKRMEKKFIRLTLKYNQAKKGIINGLRRVSKPGRRIYVGRGSLPRVQSGFGTAIISTSKGLMTDAAARAAKLGGEVLCNIW
jgi:small subunit ribosomal protein S8